MKFEKELSAVAEALKSENQRLGNRGQNGLAGLIMGAVLAMIVAIIGLLVVGCVEAQAGTTLVFKTIVFLVISVTILLVVLGGGFFLAGLGGSAPR